MPQSSTTATQQCWGGDEHRVLADPASVFARMIPAATMIYDSHRTCVATPSGIATVGRDSLEAQKKLNTEEAQLRPEYTTSAFDVRAQALIPPQNV